MKGLALFALPLVAVLAMLFGVVVVLAPVQPSPALTLAASSCTPQPPAGTTGTPGTPGTVGEGGGVGGATGIHLDAEQRSVAARIIAVGKSLHVSPRGWVVALAAGMQESGLRPLRYGDRDSLGVFQQRAAWGTVTERINPASAARMFFTGGHGGQRGLLDIAVWEQMPVTVAAQAVQVSAYPDAYAKWEQLAVQLVGSVANVDASCAPAGGWVFPLGRARYVLTAGFGECGARWAHCHTGQDFAVPTGTPVLAAGAGVVTFAGWAGAYGNAVHVLHAGGVATWYCHLSRIDTHWGAHVRAGDLVGLSGSTGNTTGPHLHLEVRTGASATSAGSPIDPMPWLHQHHLL